VVLGSWYGNKAARLHFGESFHRKRLRIVGSQVSSLSPALTGRWSKGRRLDLAWRMVRRTRPSRLITHRFDLGEAEKAYDLIDRGSDRTVQVLLDHGGG
jgi:threonine dehydrogenase-like Zn-dependent dehydrogenase